MKLKPSIYNKDGEALIAELVGEIFSVCNCKFKQDVGVATITTLHNEFPNNDYHLLTRDRSKINPFTAANYLYTCGWEIDKEIIPHLELLFYRIEMEFINLEVEWLRSRNAQHLNENLALRQLTNKHGELIPLRPSIWNKKDRETIINRCFIRLIKERPHFFRCRCDGRCTSKKDCARIVKLNKDRILFITNKYLMDIYGFDSFISDGHGGLCTKGAFSLAKDFESYGHRVDNVLVKLLDELTGLIYDEWPELESEWEIKNQPLWLPIGTPVSVVDNKHGVIEAVHTYYVVNDQWYLPEHVKPLTTIDITH
ncbi:TPA: hypothetical protein ACN36B_004394 [Vibrio parahaemolyticus]